MKCAACGEHDYISHANPYRGIICDRCNKMGDLTKDFSRHEFSCKCGCNFDKINIAFVEKLQRIRDMLGYSLKVVSGCRCKKHNRDVGGDSTSDHTGFEPKPQTKGADIEVNNSGERYDLCEAAYKVKMPRIGPAKTFVHLGMSPEEAQRVMWLY
jgi:zinc D-Ala-D-Ala carboxypeptidase